MDTTSKKPTARYWIIAVFALVWNTLGVVAYLGQAYMTDDTLAALPESNQLYYSNLPAWVTAAFAIAVFGGFLGAIGLLWRKKWAFFLFVASLVAIIIQQIHSFFIQEYIEITGAQVVLPALTLAIAVYLVYFSKKNVGTTH
jgi:hypothetical protein